MKRVRFHAAVAALMPALLSYPARAADFTIEAKNVAGTTEQYVEVTWPAEGNWLYFAEASETIEEGSWRYLPEAIVGAPDTLGVLTFYPERPEEPDTRFLRVIRTEDLGGDGMSQDNDYDDLPNAEEFANLTDPLNRDTDGDGLLDGFEVNNGLDPLDATGPNGAAGDPDEDDWTNLQEQDAGTHPKNWDTDGDGRADSEDPTPTVNDAIADPDGSNLAIDSGLFARWDFETLDQYGSLASTPPSTGAFEIANTAATWDGVANWLGELTGIPSRAVHFRPPTLATESFPSAFAKLPATVFSGKNTQTWSMWLQFPKNGLAGLVKKRTLFAMGKFEGAVDATQNPHIHCYLDPGATTARSDDRLKIDTYWLPNDGYTQRNLASWSVPADFDDGEWHHVAIAFGGGDYQFHFDAQQAGVASSNPVNINLSGGTPWCYVGKFRASPPFAEFQSLGARLDRLRIYNCFLSTTAGNHEIEKIHRQDIDRDGLYDHTESHVRRWRDFNGDGLRQISETVFMIDPFHYDEVGTDHDDDEIPSHTEQTAGLKAWYFDSDGDRLPDGWEDRYDGLDPNNPDSDGDGIPDAQDDSDGDGVTNLNELIYQTDPTATDSDGDQVGDATEIAQGSMPADGADEGQAPDSDQVLSLELHVGDPSTSSSERWIMEVFSMRTGQRILSHQAQSFGAVSAETYQQFRRGEAYLLKLRHAGTDPDKLAADEAGFYPDYDWRMAVVPKGTDNGKSLGEIFPVILDPWNQETLRVVPPSALNDVNVRLLTAPTSHIGPFDGKASKDDLYQTSVRERGVLLAPVQIAVDADGDGTVEWTGEEDSTSQEKPYRFWLNNDADTGSDSEARDLAPPGSGEEDEDELADEFDYQSEALGGMRDLEDQAPLEIRVPGLVAPLKLEYAGGTVDRHLKARLVFRNKTGTPAINFRPHKGTKGDNLLDYLENLDAATQMSTVVTHGSVGAGQDAFFYYTLWTNWGYNAPDEQDPTLRLLFEGATEGSGELVLEFVQDGEVVATAGTCWINLQDIRTMYEIYGTGGTNGEEDYQVINGYLPNTDNYDVPSPSAYDFVARWADSGQYPPPDANTPEEEKDYLLFVHGWRMKPWEKRCFADTAFKRLWWRGFRGRFGMFQWPTEWTSRPAGTALWDRQNYNRSDRKALLSAAALRSLLHTLNDTYPGRVRLFAHSMGGVVVSEALRLESLQAQPATLLHSSILMQSASVAGAYDAAGPETLTEAYVQTKEALQPWLDEIALTLGSPDARIPNVWASYPSTGQPLFASIGTASDNIQNFHNFEDDALAWWLINQIYKPQSHRDRDNYQTITELNTGVPPSYRWARGPVEYDNPPYGMTISDDPVTNNPFRFVTVGQRTGRFLIFPDDAYEILSFAAESKTTPLGASVGNGHSTAGPIGGNVDLYNGTFTNPLTFKEEDHSGQFRATNMMRWEIWRELLSQSQIITRRPTNE